MLFSYIKNWGFKIISNALFEFKNSNRIKRNFKRKNYVNSFCLISLSLIFLWRCWQITRMKLYEYNVCLKMCHYRIWLIRWYKIWSKPFSIATWMKIGWINCQKYIMTDLTSCSIYRHLQVISSFVNYNFVKK